MIRTGYCECDITPPENAPMGAFSKKTGKPRISTGIHLPLKVASLCISDGEKTAVICASDTLLHQTKDILEIRKLVSKRSSIPSENIMICSTHTHSGGENTYLFEKNPKKNKWLNELNHRIADAIVCSIEEQFDADIFFTQTKAPFNHNRRAIKNARSTMLYDRNEQTTGPVDDTLSLLRFDLSNGHRIWWTNWTAHALTIGPENDKISSDYPGKLNFMIESQFSGSRAFFTNGCAGNTHPMKSMKKGFETSEEIAAKLFEKIKEASRKMRKLQPKLQISSETLKLIHRKNNQPIRIIESCIDIGEVKIGFLPGEPYVEFQMAFRKALSPVPCFVNGYSNGWSGYLPTEKSFSEGGYGVDYFEELPGVPMDFGRTQINPGDGEVILEKLIELAKRQN